MIGCAQSPRVHGCRNGRHAGDVDGHSPRNQYGHRVAQLRAHTLGHEHGLYRVPHTRERAYTHLDSGLSPRVGARPRGLHAYDGGDRREGNRCGLRAESPYDRSLGHGHENG